MAYNLPLKHFWPQPMAQWLTLFLIVLHTLIVGIEHWLKIFENKILGQIIYEHRFTFLINYF